MRSYKRVHPRLGTDGRALSRRHPTCSRRSVRFGLKSCNLYWIMESKMEITIMGSIAIIGCIHIYIYRGYIGVM